MSLLDLKSTVIALTVGLAIGTTAGFCVKGQFVKASEVAATEVAAKQTADGIVRAQETSQRVETQTQQVAAQIQEIETAAHTRFAKQKEIQNAIQKSSPEAARNCPAVTLDVGTVGLLNAARQGAAVDAAGGSDEALAAPSDIGIEKLADSDLEVVRLYRDLAKRHDELVDAVEEHLKQQAE